MHYRDTSLIIIRYILLVFGILAITTASVFASETETLPVTPLIVKSTPQFEEPNSIIIYTKANINDITYGEQGAQYLCNLREMFGPTVTSVTGDLGLLKAYGEQEPVLSDRTVRLVIERDGAKAVAQTPKVKQGTVEDNTVSNILYVEMFRIVVTSNNVDYKVSHVVFNSDIEGFSYENGGPIYDWYNPDNVLKEQQYIGSGDWNSTIWNTPVTYYVKHTVNSYIGSSEFTQIAQLGQIFDTRFEPAEYPIFLGVEYLDDRSVLRTRSSPARLKIGEDNSVSVKLGEIDSLVGTSLKIRNIKFNNKTFFNTKDLLFQIDEIVFNSSVSGIEFHKGKDILWDWGTTPLNDKDIEGWKAIKIESLLFTL